MPPHPTWGCLNERTFLTAGASHTNCPSSRSHSSRTAASSAAAVDAPVDDVA